MTYTPKDRFFHKAKAEGYLARSAYKLEEIQKKFKVMRHGDFILDLGASPGSWSQYACKIVGGSGSGRVVGLDLKPVEFKAPNAAFYQMDVFNFDEAILEGRVVNCLLSDMAPNTTGIRNVDQSRSAELCSEILKLSRKYLTPRGNLVMKLFEGPDSEKIAKELAKDFQQSKRLKPEAVRKGSFEIYFIGLSKK